MLPALLLLAQFPFFNPWFTADTDEHRSDRKIVIYHDEGRDSKVLVSELTRDWHPNRSTTLAIISTIQSDLKQRVELVHRDKAGLEFSRIHDGYPFYRYGQYGEIQKFDRRMFSTSGQCLLALKSIVDNQSINTTLWKESCETAAYCSERRHQQEVAAWIATVSWLSYEQLMADTEGGIETLHPTDLQSRFCAYGGIPEYIAPVLPESPLKKMPWEPNYVSPLALAPSPEELVP